MASSAFCGLSGAAPGEKTVALTGLTTGPGPPPQEPKPSVNQTADAATSTITPTSAASAAIRPVLRFVVVPFGESTVDQDERRFAGGCGEKVAIVSASSVLPSHTPLTSTSSPSVSSTAVS